MNGIAVEPRRNGGRNQWVNVRTGQVHPDPVHGVILQTMTMILNPCNHPLHPGQVQRNQEQYPQSNTQADGVGLPIARAVTVLSLATGCALDAAIGPYQGKHTGEPALLRRLLPALRPDDVAVTDRYYCSFMMIALMLGLSLPIYCHRLSTARTHKSFS